MTSNNTTPADELAQLEQTRDHAAEDNRRAAEAVKAKQDEINTAQRAAHLDAVTAEVQAIDVAALQRGPDEAKNRAREALATDEGFFGAVVNMLAAHLREQRMLDIRNGFVREAGLDLDEARPRSRVFGAAYFDTWEAYKLIPKMIYEVARERVDAETTQIEQRLEAASDPQVRRQLTAERVAAQRQARADAARQHRVDVHRDAVFAHHANHPQAPREMYDKGWVDVLVFTEEERRQLGLPDQPHRNASRH